jgi:hypothetical protein
LKKCSANTVPRERRTQTPTLPPPQFRELSRCTHFQCRSLLPYTACQHSEGYFAPHRALGQACSFPVSSNPFFHPAGRKHSLMVRALSIAMSSGKCDASQVFQFRDWERAAYYEHEGRGLRPQAARGVAPSSCHSSGPRQTQCGRFLIGWGTLPLAPKRPDRPAHPWASFSCSIASKNKSDDVHSCGRLSCTSFDVGVAFSATPSEQGMHKGTPLE